MSGWGEEDGDEDEDEDEEEEEDVPGAPCGGTEYVTVRKRRSSSRGRPSPRRLRLWSNRSKFSYLPW
jgi:hypothetical protein